MTNPLIKSAPKLRRLTIRRGLPWIILIFTLSSIAITTVNYQVIRALSLSRAYINAESLYAKHRAHAVEEMIRYAYNQNIFHFQQFKEEIAIPLNGIELRSQIVNENLEFEWPLFQSHLLQAGLSETDAALIVSSFKRFQSSGFVEKSVRRWEQVDPLLIQLMAQGVKIHEAISSSQWSLKEREAELLKLHQINTKIILLEDEFAEWIEQESQQLEQILLRVSVGITLLFMAVSLAAAVYFGQRFRRGVMALYRTALRITQGDLSARVTLPPGDELSKLAEKFNQMTATISESQERLIEQNQQLVDAKDMALQSLNAKSEFLANMSHEIRTPMNGVLGMLELLSTTELNEFQRECVTLSLNSAATLLNLINDVLDLSKIESGKLVLESVEFDLHQCVEEIASLYSAQNKQADLEIACYIAPNVPQIIRGDPTRLRQILANLMANAIKFTESGSVVVRCHTVESRENNHCLLHFEIEDTGIGIAPENQDKLFDAFVQADGSTTRRHGGTGLGLTIASELKELMGGDIGVDSQLGEGARFWFTIDVMIVAPYPSEPTLANLHGWLIGNDSINLRILSQYLDEWNIQIKRVMDPVELLSQLAQHSVDRAPDFIMLDDRLEGVSQIQLHQRLLADPKLNPVPMIALNRFKDYLLEPNDMAPYFEQLSKPLRLSILRRALLRLHADTDETITTTQESLPPLQGHIMIVEDNKVNQQVALRMVEKLGLTADIANSGEEAIQLVHEKPFDLILMDCQMPDLDGYQTTAIIRQEESIKEIPIIAITANAIGPVKQRCINAGMDACLIKPVKLELLYQTLAVWLSSNCKNN